MRVCCTWCIVLRAKIEFNQRSFASIYHWNEARASSLSHCRRLFAKLQYGADRRSQYGSQRGVPQLLSRNEGHNLLLHSASQSCRSAAAPEQGASTTQQVCRSWFAGVFAMKATTAALALSVGLCHLFPRACLAFHPRIPIVHAPVREPVAPLQCSTTASWAAAPYAGEVGDEGSAWLENFELDSTGKVRLRLPNQ